MQQEAQSTRTEMRPVKYHYADTFWCTYIVSVLSANVAELGKFSMFFLSFEPDSWQIVLLTLINVSDNCI